MSARRLLTAAIALGLVVTVATGVAAASPDPSTDRCMHDVVEDPDCDGDLELDEDGETSPSPDTGSTDGGLLGAVADLFGTLF